MIWTILGYVLGAIVLIILLIVGTTLLTLLVSFVRIQQYLYHEWLQKQLHCYSEELISKICEEVKNESQS
ncbi:hypothetical protein O3794_02735 [Gemella sanguinis]|uniref:hypothetical protein n=1 Tax=Gemella sanguinis TaxID=84135 RepID=UPI00352DF8A7